VRIGRNLQGSLARAIGNFVNGNWESKVRGLGGEVSLEEVISSAWVQERRGADPSTLAEVVDCAVRSRRISPEHIRDAMAASVQVHGSKHWTSKALTLSLDAAQRQTGDGARRNVSPPRKAGDAMRPPANVRAPGIDAIVERWCSRLCLHTAPEAGLASRIARHFRTRLASTPARGEADGTHDGDAGAARHADGRGSARRCSTRAMQRRLHAKGTLGKAGQRATIQARLCHPNDEKEAARVAYALCPDEEEVAYCLARDSIVRRWGAAGGTGCPWEAPEVIPAIARELSYAKLAGVVACWDGRSTTADLNIQY